MYLSMYMRKNSVFTPFVANALMKMTESGIKESLKQRHDIAEPNCKPLRIEGRSLGMPFFSSLFVFYIFCCILCAIILIFEHIFKPNRRSSQLRPGQIRLDQIKLEHIRLEQIRLDQIRLDQIRLDQIRIDQIRLDQLRLDQLRLNQIRVDQIRLRNTSSYAFIKLS